jgi:FKBP-type peptidyl-prolyl cis-trans isomerase (trigger factor)
MKVRITVEETLKYTDEIVVEQPESMSDAEFDRIIEQAERNLGYDGTAKDLAYLLEERYGLKIVDQSENFPDSPMSNDFEIIDVMNVKE